MRSSEKSFMIRTNLLLRVLVKFFMHQLLVHILNSENTYSVDNNTMVRCARYASHPAHHFFSMEQSSLHRKIIKQRPFGKNSG